MELAADLHIHTSVSDGSDTFEQVAQLAVEQMLDLIAFTNHDTLKGIQGALSLQERYPLTVIGGIEISAWDSEANTKAHILGLGFTSEDAPAISALCAPLLKQRHANTEWQLEQLLNHGYALDLTQVRYLAKDATGLYKQHLMAALTTEPFESEQYETLYRSLFKGSGCCSRDISYVDARDAVAAIKEDGGFAVLAHPGPLDNYELVKHLVPVGLDGIERNYPEHSAEDRRIIDQLAEDYALFCTGGSDYHGSFGEVPYPGYERILLSGDAGQGSPLASFLTSLRALAPS